MPARTLTGHKLFHGSTDARQRSGRLTSSVPDVPLEGINSLAADKELSECRGAPGCGARKGLPPAGRMGVVGMRRERLADGGQEILMTKGFQTEVAINQDLGPVGEE